MDKWEIKIDRFGAIRIADKDENFTIAIINAIDGAEKNAKLIAAAPELLELAYEFRAVMNHLSGRMGEQMEINVNELIEQAIKKAT